MNSIKNTLKLLSIIVSVYNEEDVIEQFFVELKNNLDTIGIAYEIIFVDDGSTDNSLQIMMGLLKNITQTKIVALSKNYGHEAAMIAGIDISSGDAVICMDADLQHPPSIIEEMLGKFSEGYEIVNMVRTENKDSGFINKALSKLFYCFLNKISSFKFEKNSSDFFLISKRVAVILKNDFRERTRYLRGLIQIIGFKKTTIDFVAPKRAGGKSKYSLIKLFNFSLHAIFTFSNFPIRLGILASIIAGFLGVVVAIHTIITKLFWNAPPGYATIIVLICFMFSIQFFITGVIGEYLGFIFTENKKRPLYIIDKIYFSDSNDNLSNN